MASVPGREQLAGLVEDARIAIELLGGQQPGARQAKRIARLMARVEAALEARGDHLGTLLAADGMLAARHLEFLDEGPRKTAIQVLLSALATLAGVPPEGRTGHGIPSSSPIALANELRALQRAPLLSGNGVFATGLDAQSLADDRDIGPRLPEDLPARIRRLRSHYQKGLIAWLRDSDSEAAALGLADVFRRLAALCAGAPPQRLWQVAVAFALVLADRRWRQSAAVKRLLGQLDGQLKHLADDSPRAFVAAPPSALLRSLLFYVGAGGGRTREVAEVRLRYQLPDAFEPPGGGGDEPTAVLALLHELLGVSGALMEALPPGGSWPQKRALLAERLRHAADGLGLLGLHPVRRLALEEVALMEATPASGDPPPGGWGQMAERLHAVGSALLGASGMEPAAVVAEDGHAEAAGALLSGRLEADLVHAEAVIRRLEEGPDESRGAASARQRGNFGLGDDGEDSTTALRERLERLSVEVEQHVSAGELAGQAKGDREEERAVPLASELIDDIVITAGEIDGARTRLEQRVGEFREGLQDMEAALGAVKEQLESLRADADAAAEMAHLRERLEDLSRGLADVDEMRGAMETIAGDSRSILAQQARDSLALEQQLMRTRMQPLGGQLEELRRRLAENAAGAGKQVLLDLEAADLSIEPEKLERLVPTLESLLGAVIRHGVERPHERVMGGRSPGCPLVVSFKRRGADLDIRLQADCPPPPPEALVEAEMHLLGLGGRLDMDTGSAAPMGCILRVPLAPRVTTVLLVEVGTETHALPLDEVSGVLQVPGERLQDSPGILEHGGLEWCLVSLADLLRRADESTLGTSERVPLVLVEGDGRRLALVVDRIGDRADVVVRSVGCQLRGIACLAGATILGDGQVVLIIDLAELIRASALSEASPELLLSPS